MARDADGTGGSGTGEAARAVAGTAACGARYRTRAGTHLPLFERIALIWRTSVAPLAVQTAGGMVAAVLLLAGLFRLFGPGVEVQANDDGLAHLIAPHYLYSQVPPTAVETGRDVPVLIDAKVDTRGRVYDYTILDGPSDRRCGGRWSRTC